MVPGIGEFGRAADDPVLGDPQLLLDVFEQAVYGGQPCPGLHDGVVVWVVERQTDAGPVGGSGDEFGRR